ncbi:MAG: hypothetical protein WAW96_13530 [Alphaproteobacteria bacterium]
MLTGWASRPGTLAARGARFAVLALIVVAALWGCGQQGGTKSHGMGALVPFLDTGTRGFWTATMKDGVYTLANTQEPRALRTITLLRTNDPKYSESVDILFGGDTKGVAGLVLAHNAAQKHYYLLSLKPEGRMVLYNRTATNLTIELDQKVDLRPGFNRLAFEGNGNSIVIKVNGQKIADYVAQGLSEGGAGIAVLGLGTYSFTNFETTGYERNSQPGRAQAQNSQSTKPTE